MRIGRRFAWAAGLALLLSAGDLFHLTQPADYLAARLYRLILPADEAGISAPSIIALDPEHDRLDSAWVAGLLPLLAEFGARSLTVSEAVDSLAASAGPGRTEIELRGLTIVQRVRELEGGAALAGDALAAAEIALGGWDAALDERSGWMPTAQFSRFDRFRTPYRSVPLPVAYVGGGERWAGGRYRIAGEKDLYLMPLPAASVVLLTGEDIRTLHEAEARLVAWSWEFSRRAYRLTAADSADLLSPYRAAAAFVDESRNQGGLDPRYRLFREIYLASIAAALDPETEERLKREVTADGGRGRTELVELIARDFAAGRSRLREFRRLRENFAAAVADTSVILGYARGDSRVPSRLEGLAALQAAGPAGTVVRFVPAVWRVLGYLLILVPLPLFAGRRMLLMCTPVCIVLTSGVSLLLFAAGNIYFPVLPLAFATAIFFPIAAGSGSVSGRRPGTVTPDPTDQHASTEPAYTVLLSRTAAECAAETTGGKASSGGAPEGTAWLSVPGRFRSPQKIVALLTRCSGEEPLRACITRRAGADSAADGGGVPEALLTLGRAVSALGAGIFLYGREAEEWPEECAFRERGMIPPSPGAPPLWVVELICSDDPRYETVEAFNEGFRLFGRGRYRESARRFRACLEAAGDDAGARYYLRRIAKKFPGSNG